MSTTSPLMPKATAIWLIENTSLTFDQISDFCGLHLLEIQAIADGEAAFGMIGLDPIVSAQLTAEEIKRCEENPNARLHIREKAIVLASKAKKKSARYTPLARRQDRPDAIAWIIKNYPDIDDKHVCRLLGTTKNTVQAIRNKSHWNSQNIKPRHPVNLGLCTQTELERVLLTVKPKRTDDGDTYEN